MLKIVSFLYLWCVFVVNTQAQELKATVLVNTEQITTGDQRLDNNLAVDMQTNIANFINTYKWTNHTFQSFERINCTFQINIKQFTSSQYIATMQVVATRPIYNTTYETEIFNFLDNDFNFIYAQSTSINYNENAYVNSLSSLLSYYVYLILANDYDSYSNLGGQIYLDKAQQILNNAQTTSDVGWKSNDGSNSSNNRYWIVENLTNSQQLTMREIMYNYHFKALDKFLDTPDSSRKVIIKCLEDLKAMNRIKPNSLTMKWFFNMKDVELVNIFTRAPQDIRLKTYSLLMELDPSSSDKYAVLTKPQ